MGDSIGWNSISDILSLSLDLGKGLFLSEANILLHRLLPGAMMLTNNFSIENAMQMEALAYTKILIEQKIEGEMN